MKYPLAHLVQRPPVEYMAACDHGDSSSLKKRIDAAKKKRPLAGPVQVVKVAPFNLMHPDHPRHHSSVKGPLQ